jgi:hypothetical protein
MTPPRVRHRLIIGHPSESMVLFVYANGAPRLPSFVSDDRHTADVDYINDAAHEQLRLHTTVLRSHWHSEARDGVVDRVHELVVHGLSLAKSSSARPGGSEPRPQIRNADPGRSWGNGATGILRRSGLHGQAGSAIDWGAGRRSWDCCSRSVPARTAAVNYAARRT